MNKAVTFKSEKRSIIKIAEDLLYPDSIIKMLEEAKTLRELDRIMTTARHSI